MTEYFHFNYLGLETILILSLFNKLLSFELEDRLFWLGVLPVWAGLSAVWAVWAAVWPHALPI